MWQTGIEVRQDITAAVLRKKARSEKDGRVAARMLGIANILDGMSRTFAAKAAGMDRQTLRDWVHRYNKEGLAGLNNRPKGRPERALTLLQEQEIDALVAQPPEGTLVRWRRADIKAEIERRYGVSLHEASVGRLLRRLGFVRLTARPIHPENDPEVIEAFKKTSPPTLQKSSPCTPKAKPSSFGSKTKRGLGKKAR
jgi:transposase